MVPKTRISWYNRGVKHFYIKGRSAPSIKKLCTLLSLPDNYKPSVAFLIPPSVLEKAHQPTSFPLRLAKKSQRVGSKMLRRQQKASSRNFPARVAHTYCHKQRTTGRKEKKNYSGMYMSQSMFNTLYASVHTERKEKNFISKSIFLLKRMLFARQHCDWPPVPDFDHKACNVRHG